MKPIGKLFEGALWNSRLVVILAVIGSVAAGFTVFYMTTVDVVYLVMHVLAYGDAALSPEARKALHDETITHMIEIVDGYLIATVMLIFSLGLYELFLSDIDEARRSRTSSKILVIENLDDLKSRLAKLIIMILIVRLFEDALIMELASPQDLLYLGGAISLIGLALYLAHVAEQRGGER